jgi:hypothetical protein
MSLTPTPLQEEETQRLQDGMLFPLMKFPVEIRSCVWEYALPDPPHQIIVCEIDRGFVLCSPPQSATP